MKKLIPLILVSLPAFGGDVIINESGYHEASSLQKAVFVSIFLPDEMVCSQPVTFVQPRAKLPDMPEVTECGEGVLVISPSVCEK